MAYDRRIDRIVESYGVEPDTIDLNALYDNSLTFSENRKNIVNFTKMMNPDWQTLRTNGNGRDSKKYKEKLRSLGGARIGRLTKEEKEYLRKFNEGATGIKTKSKPKSKKKIRKKVGGKKKKMAGLPKKYAKMGFKKGWREYKKTKAKSRRTPTRTRTTKKRTTRRKTVKRRVVKMAKRKKARRRTTRRRKSTTRRTGGNNLISNILKISAGSLIGLGIMDYLSVPTGGAKPTISQLLTNMQGRIMGIGAKISNPVYAIPLIGGIIIAKGSVKVPFVTKRNAKLLGLGIVGASSVQAMVTVASPGVPVGGLGSSRSAPNGSQFITVDRRR